MADKVNPFKEQQQSQMTKKQNSRLDREVTISLSPRKFLRGFLLVAMLFAVFYVGRFSVGATACQLPDFSGFMDVFSSDNANPSGLAVAEKKEANETAELPAEDPVSGAEELAAETPSNETADSAGSADEIVVVSYSKVAISLDEVYKEWKGTWGKIIGIKYTIKNNEVGTIKPHHFTMLVEGYDDIEKQFEVGIATQRVKAGVTAQDEAAVGGFSYSPKSIPDGDLKKVKISLFLYDAENKLIASHHRDVNLEG
ncbi:MAG: hypothetical protein AABW53_02490 [Nanoarchaeota archaeon]